jgi:hypothetical protein
LHPTSSEPRAGVATASSSSDFWSKIWR